MGEVNHTLVLDVGNTKIKSGVFVGAELVSQSQQTSLADLEHLFQYYPIKHAIIGKVGMDEKEIETFIQSKVKTLYLSTDSALPFTNLYQTPSTLGMDRVAGVIGAQHFFPTQACLVIDIGTCITFDFIDAQSQYHGGAISPGLNMRLQAMHQFTAKLPLIHFEQEPELIGKSTTGSMLSGTFYGMLGEINEVIARYEERFGQLEVILCGGDAPLFGKHIKNNIFAAPNLVLYGLNKILLFNVEKGL